MRAAVWIVVGALGVVAVSALIAAAPERLRPVVIMPALFGALTGYGLRRLAQELNLGRSLLCSALAGLLAVAGLVNVARLSFEQLADTARGNVKEDPQQLLGLRLLESELAAGPGRDARRQFELARLRLSPTFQDYLMGRLLGFAWVPAPWPAVIWSGELLLSAGIATVVMYRHPSGNTGPPENTDGAQPEL